MLGHPIGCALEKCFLNYSKGGDALHLVRNNKRTQHSKKKNLVMYKNNQLSALNFQNIQCKGTKNPMLSHQIHKLICHNTKTIKLMHDLQKLKFHGTKKLIYCNNTYIN